jgi:hypothetical protein
MALIPMKQTVTITPASTLNEWGEMTTGTPYTIKCRVDEGTKLVRGMTNSGGVHGTTAEEVVSTARIYFDKIVNISTDDVISFTDEIGNVKTYTPISVEIKRGLSGKALLTVVNV